MDSKVLPVKEHIKALLNGEAHNEPCEIGPSEQFQLPPWYDDKKYKRGQKYMQDNLFAQFTCSLTGLVSVLAIPSILNILMKTKKSSCFTGAYRRYISTIFHVYCWIHEDLKPNTEAWKSLMVVRTRHCKTSRSSNRRGEGHISQRDMALTQFGFLGVALLFPEKIGMRHNNQEDIEAYVFFWRTIGYMLGIDDKYNLCRPSLEESREVFETLRSQVYGYYLKYPPEYFYFMTSAILQSMWYYSPLLSEGSYIYYTMWLMGIDGYDYNRSMDSFKIKLLSDPKNAIKEDSLVYATNNNIVNQKCESEVNMEKELGLYNRFILHLTNTVHRWLKSSFGLSYFNRQTRVTIFLLKNIPFLSFFRFGISLSYIDMFKDDIAYPSQPKTNREMFVNACY